MKTAVRNVAIGAILALSAGGSIAASVAMPLVAPASAAVVASGTGAAPNSFYHT